MVTYACFVSYKYIYHGRDWRICPVIHIDVFAQVILTYSLLLLLHIICTDYPIDNFPSLHVQNMSKAFEMILEGTLVDEEGLLMLNASIDTRNRITRIQFSWYQFQEFPSDLFGRAYSNLQHLDIRQNGKSHMHVYMLLCMSVLSFVTLESHISLHDASICTV